MNLAYLEYMEKRKSATAAYFLLYSLGIFGAHRWYLHEEKAQAMLILGIVSIVTLVVGIGLIGLIILIVWCVKDFFRIEEWVMTYNVNLVAELGLE